MAATNPGPRAAALALAVLLTILAACAGFAPEAVERAAGATREGQYRLDPHHATLLFKVRHMGLAPYVGRFNAFDVALDFDPENPAATRLQATIDTASIDVNYPSFASTLAGPGWLDSARHPTATFVSTAVSWRDASHARVDGILTLRGIAAPASLDVTFHGATRHVITGTYTLGFSANATLKRSDWGIDKHIPVVDDEVAIEIHAELQRRRAAGGHPCTICNWPLPSSPR